MSNNLKKIIKLSDSDRRTILKNINVCTDAHGKTCEILQISQQNKKLN